MRSVKLFISDGVTRVESGVIERGFVYKLITPVEIRDSDNNIRESYTEFIFNGRVNRAIQRKWSKVTDDEDRADAMVMDCFDINKAIVDELFPTDLINLVEIVGAFLPHIAP